MLMIKLTVKQKRWTILLSRHNKLKYLTFITKDQFYWNFKNLHYPNNKSYTLLKNLVSDDIFVDHKINVSSVPLLEWNKEKINNIKRLNIV